MKSLFLLLFCLSATFSATAQKAQPVQFSWGIEILPENFNDLKQPMKVPAAELSKGKFVRYVQFEKTLNATERTALSALGIDVCGYVYPATYLLLLPEAIDFQQLERFSPRSVVPLKPEWKMAKSLREPPYGQWAVHGDWIDVNLQAYPNTSIQEAAELCRKNGMVVLKEGTQNGFVQVRMLQKSLLEIAALPFIQYMELLPPPGEKEDTRGRSLHRSSAIDIEYPMGKKYNGEGVRTLVRDDGQVGPHIDFQGRLFNLAPTAASSGTHGDGVGGIIGGAANLDPSKKGMAKGADVFVIDYISDFQDETLPLHLNEGVTLTNSSYSNGCNTGYTLASQTVDMQLYKYPTLMHVFSAGNSNSQDCNYGAGTQWGNITGGHKMAKNALAAANLLQDATLDNTSSRGPAHDGRLKPDISANGTNHFSTSTGNTYQEFGGTSGAAPGIVGCLAQLTQAYKTIHGGQEPNATLLKATILNTANDLGNVGPDFKFGWGHINAWRALDLLEQNRHRSNAVDQGAENTHSLQVPLNTRQAKVMIVWADPPANPEAARALLNDLDLRVVAPDGTTVYLPWKLDPTPIATILDTPAGKGRDSLNNVEQVSINDPVAGLYTIRVNGKDVPAGPQEYYLVWDFYTDNLKLTYPAGGEGFVTGEVERLHWDAYGIAANFTLRYSLDGGASFSPITTVTGEKRMYDWTVPNILSGNVKLLLIRGGKRDTMDFPLSIAPVPQNLKVARVCPDSMTLSWNEANDTLTYDVYVLGAKYMEIVGTADTNRFSFPINNAGLSRWVAVRTSHPNGMTSRRTIAVNWPGELKGCPQDKDLGVRKLLAPAGDAIVSCSASSQDITVRIRNEGLTPTSSAQISYQVDNEPIVTEIQPDILPGDSLDFTFQTPIVVTTNGIVSIKIWSDYPGDVTNFNDTLSIVLPVVAEAVSGNFKESFEAAPTTPLGWIVTNPDNDVTWKLTNQYPNLIGINGDTTRAFFLDHYSYNDDEQTDNLYMIPMDLSNHPNPALGFDLAHRRFNASYTDGLRVELFINCDLSGDPVVLFERFDPELSTLPPSTVFFVPSSATDWFRHSIDLGDYAGQSVIIRFVSINGYGNNTFLDNIGIEEFIAPVLPIAEIQNPIDSICRQQSAVFEANQLTTNTQYSWTFGPPSTPSSASGPGPHTINFPAQGAKVVRLIATNTFGSDTTYHSLTVLPFPASNFSQSANNLTVTFSNFSTNATSYLWDFGDGMTSTTPSPVHTFAAPGTYSVKLEAINQCSTAMKTIPVVLTSKVNDLSEQMGVSILPNPSEGDFVVKIESQVSEDIQLNLIDAQGKLVKTIASSIKQGITNIPIEGLQLPKGMYQLNLIGKSGQATLNLVIQ